LSLKALAKREAIPANHLIMSEKKLYQKMK
jgi:hypothetical protein